jgi:hypothetical protein
MCFLGAFLKKKELYLKLVMSKTKGQTLQYSLGTKPKHIGIVPKFVSLKADCFSLVQDLLTWTK